MYEKKAIITVVGNPALKENILTVAETLELHGAMVFGARLFSPMANLNPLEYFIMQRKYAHYIIQSDFVICVVDNKREEDDWTTWQIQFARCNNKAVYVVTLDMFNEIMAEYQNNMEEEARNLTVKYILDDTFMQNFYTSNSLVLITAFKNMLETGKEN